MNCTKFFEIFDPSTVDETIHIIGCGSVGSTIAELLARFGLTNFTLYDFDHVEAKNIANQMFNDDDIGKEKTVCVKEMISRINPGSESNILLERKGYDAQMLDGYVFLAVDNIELRKEICEANMYNNNIRAVFDVRTGLYDAQHFAANWSLLNDKKQLIRTMNFSHEEAKVNTPVSACGVEFSVAPTIRMICNIAVVNFFNFLQDGKLKKAVMAKPFDLDDTVMTIS